MSSVNRNRDWFWRALEYLFDGLASLELAVFVILSIAAVSAIGTIYEAKYGADVASLLVYRSWFFTGILFLFTLNLLFVGISRWPWKRHHVGFLVTHLGLIILLIGSLITRIEGVDGSIALTAGESTNAVRTNENYLNVFVATPGNGYERLLSEHLEFNPLSNFEHPKTWELKIPSPVNSLNSVSNKKVRIRLLDWWPYATREVGVKINDNKNLGIPAVRFRILGSRANMEEWLFLNGIQGSTIDLGPAIVRFQRGVPVVKSPSEKNTLFIYFESEKDKLPKLAQVKAKTANLIQMGSISFSEPKQLGWMDFQFLLEEFYFNATPVTNYKKAAKKEGSVEVIKVAINDSVHWLEIGAAIQVPLENDAFYLQFTKMDIPLNFTIRLNNFNVEFYEGTKQPKAYESRVSVSGKGDNILISMNEPLDAGGFTFYQSSYSTDEEGRPVVSVLSVNRDPGRWIKYLGCIMLISGILLMFYFKPIYSGKNKLFKKSQPLQNPDHT